MQCFQNGQLDCAKFLGLFEGYYPHAWFFFLWHSQGDLGQLRSRQICWRLRSILRAGQSAIPPVMWSSWRLQTSVIPFPPQAYCEWSPFKACFTQYLLYHVVKNVLNHGFSADLLNILRPEQNGWHFADNIFILTLLNETCYIFISISLKFVPEASINNMPTLIWIMAWHQTGDKPLSEPMMA